MSGTIQNNISNQSGSIAVAPAGLNWVSDVVTSSTVTVVSGNGYWINTTSNACTITLPASAEAGDNIIIVDYARTWGTNAVTLDSNGLNFQGQADTFDVEYTTDGQSVNLIYSDSTKGWIPLEDDVVAEAPVAPTPQRGIFTFGFASSSVTAVKNLVGTNGVVAADVSGVGTARRQLAGAGYGTDKAVYAYGTTGSATNLKNLVNNSGVVAADVTGVGTARFQLAGTTYGTDKAVFAFGSTGSAVSLKNLCNSSGVIAADVSGVGSVRYGLDATTYGSTGQAIFGFGYIPEGSPGGEAFVSITNLVSNTGVIAADTSGVGLVRISTAALGFGGDRGIFAYGYRGSDTNTNVSNIVSNLGVVSSDVTGVGTARQSLGGAAYGGDKGIFYSGTSADSNLVSNSGVVASDVTAVGTSRRDPAGAGYSI